MLKKVILFLLVGNNLLLPVQFSTNNQIGTNILSKIVEDVKKNRFKSDGLVDVAFESLEMRLKRAHDHIIHIKEVEKSLKIGQELLNKVKKHLPNQDQSKNIINLKQIESSIKAAQKEHENISKIIQVAKKEIQSNFDKIDNQVKRLNESLKKLNEKSKIAIEKAQPHLILQRSIIPLE